MTNSQLSGRRVSPWFILAIISLPVFIGALDLTIISAVLPEVIVSLKLPVKDYLDQASWAVNGYLLAYAISMTFAGRISDLVGRRAVYIVCLLIFMGGSYLVTVYDSSVLNSLIARFYNVVLDQRPPRLEERHLYLVIAGRIVQALGAGAMVPVTIALVGDLFAPEHRAKPLGVVGAIDTMGWVLGHLYGGVMVHFFGLNGQKIVDAVGDIGLSISTPSWETLFILNIPISLIALGAAWWVLRRVPQPMSGGRFDIWGTVFFMFALIGLNLGLGTSPETAASASSLEDLKGSSSDYTLYFLIAAALSFLIFLFVESRLSDPLIKLSMFRRRNFSAASFTNLLVGYCLAIGLVSAPLLVNIRAESPTSADIQAAAYVAGLLLSALTIPMALAAVPGGWLSERYGHRIPTMIGLAMASGGFLLAGLIWEGDTSYWIMASQMAVIGVGLGLTISPISTAVLNDAHEDERGVASALVLLLRLVGMTIAISSLTIFSLERLNYLVEKQALEQPAAETSSGETETGEVVDASIDANFNAAVQVIDELQFIGAGVSALGLLSAALLVGGQLRQVTPKRNTQTGEIVRALPKD
jgi:MFS family permease